MPFQKALFALLWVAVAPVLAQPGALDPAFDKVPFDKWLSSGEQARIRWAVRVTRASLTMHQRMVADVEVQIDGADLDSRRGKGQLVIFTQFQDAGGRLFQSHGTIELTKLQDDVKKSYITFTQPAFVLPGDYRLAVAIFDTATEEHSARQEKVRIPPLKNDPLPDSWRELTAVEFVSAAAAPEGWYLPAIKGRLHLDAGNRRPARVEVILNVTASDVPSGRGRRLRGSLGLLIPALKAISQVEIQGGSLNAELLDLSRRKVTWRQTGIHDLNWSGIQEALVEANPGTIDIKSLEGRHHSAAFFVSEAGRRIAPSPGDPAADARIVIVLSSAVEFESGEDLQPIARTASPDERVFYFRFNLPPDRPSAPVRPPVPQNRGRRIGMRDPQRTVTPEPVDQLENTLKPLAPRLYEVGTPEQFRKALAAMLAEIAAL